MAQYHTAGSNYTYQRGRQQPLVDSIRYRARNRAISTSRDDGPAASVGYTPSRHGYGNPVIASSRPFDSESLDGVFPRLNRPEVEQIDHASVTRSDHASYEPHPSRDYHEPHPPRDSHRTESSSVDKFLADRAYRIKSRSQYSNYSTPGGGFTTHRGGGDDLEEIKKRYLLGGASTYTRPSRYSSSAEALRAFNDPVPQVATAGTRSVEAVAAAVAPQKSSGPAASKRSGTKSRSPPKTRSQSKSRTTTPYSHHTYTPKINPTKGSTRSKYLDTQARDSKGLRNPSQTRTSDEWGLPLHSRPVRSPWRSPRQGGKDHHSDGYTEIEDFEVDSLPSGQGMVQHNNAEPASNNQKRRYDTHHRNRAQRHGHQYDHHYEHDEESMASSHNGPDSYRSRGRSVGEESVNLSDLGKGKGRIEHTSVPDAEGAFTSGARPYKLARGDGDSISADSEGGFHPRGWRGQWSETGSERSRPVKTRVDDDDDFRPHNPEFYAENADNESDHLMQFSDHAIKPSTRVDGDDDFSVEDDWAQEADWDPRPKSSRNRPRYDPSYKPPRAAARSSSKEGGIMKKMKLGLGALAGLFAVYFVWPFGGFVQQASYSCGNFGYSECKAQGCMFDADEKRCYLPNPSKLVAQSSVSSPFRMVFVGEKGSGKTTCLNNMIYAYGGKRIRDSYNHNQKYQKGSMGRLELIDTPGLDLDDADAFYKARKYVTGLKPAQNLTQESFTWESDSSHAASRLVAVLDARQGGGWTEWIPYWKGASSKGVDKYLALLEKVDTALPVPPIIILNTFGKRSTKHIEEALDKHYRLSGGSFFALDCNRIQPLDVSRILYSAFAEDRYIQSI